MRAMAGCAAILTVAAIGWSGLTWMAPDANGEYLGPSCLQETETPGSPASSPSDLLLKLAAINYAIGLAEARAALDEREFQNAIHLFECALTARPRFAMAHTELGEARAISQSAHRSNAYYSLPSKERLDGMLRNARSTLEIAAKQGVEPNAYALNTSAVALWAKSVNDGDMALVRDAFAAVQKGNRMGRSSGRELAARLKSCRSQLLSLVIDRAALAPQSQLVLDCRWPERRGANRSRGGTRTGRRP